MPVRIDNKELRKLGKEFARLAADAPKELQRATGSINRAAKTETKRAAVGVYNITQKRVDKGLTVKPGNLKVTISGERRPINAVSYKGTVRQKKGLKFRPMKGGTAGVWKRGFIVNTKSKDGDSYSYAAQRTTDKRVPIAGIAGPSVADMLANPKVEKPLADNLLDRAETELLRRLARLKGT